MVITVHMTYHVLDAIIPALVPHCLSDLRLEEP